MRYRSKATRDAYWWLAMVIKGIEDGDLAAFEDSWRIMPAKTKQVLQSMRRRFEGTANLTDTDFLADLRMQLQAHRQFRKGVMEPRLYAAHEERLRERIKEIEDKLEPPTRIHPKK